MNTTCLLIVSGAALGLSACAAKRTVPFRTASEGIPRGGVARYDYGSYHKLPNTPTSAVYRFCLKSLPYTRDRAFWGNWGGSGCRGGPPIDKMDDIFRLHDIAYTEVKTLRTMRAADRACVQALQRLDESSMNPDALAYRDRAVSFFSNDMFAMVGKPVSAFVRPFEPKDCPLKSEADVCRLFELESLDPPAGIAPPVSIQKPSSTPWGTKAGLIQSASPISKRPPLLPPTPRLQTDTSRTAPGRSLMTASKPKENG